MICKPGDLPVIERVCGTDEGVGVSLTYIPQTQWRGIADAFLKSKEFIGTDRSALNLSDNMFHTSRLGR